MKRLVWICLILVQIVAFVPEVEAQCAMCKATVESNLDEKSSKIGKGLNTGILYLMAIPYILFGVIGYYWYKASKREKTAKDKIASILRDKLSRA